MNAVKINAGVLLLGWLCAALQIVMAYALHWNLWIWATLWKIWALAITDTWWTRRNRLKKEKQENDRNSATAAGLR